MIVRLADIGVVRTAAILRHLKPVANAVLPDPRVLFVEIALQDSTSFSQRSKVHRAESKRRGEVLHDQPMKLS